MELSLAIAIVGCIIGVLSFFYGRRDKSVKDSAEAQYKMGQIDAKLETISKQIENLSQKLDNFDREIDLRIEKAIESHIREYHTHS